VTEKKKMKNNRVLIIEDDPDFAASLVLALKLKKFDVETAGTGGKGLEMYLDGDYAVTITDIKLPDFNGIEVIRRIRESQGDARVLVMTGFRDPDLLDEAQSVGADGVLLKPFRMKELIEKVNHLNA
jgi:DNA-binding response OmpR family regulator